MPIPRSNDDDEFRAMGYVAVYGAYMEEFASKCFDLLRAHDPENPRGNRWQISAQLDSCLRAIDTLPPHDEWPTIRAVFREAKRLAGERNIAIHSPLYAMVDGENIRRTRLPENENAYTIAASIYGLAEEIFTVQQTLLAASVRLPRFIDEARQRG